MTCRSCLAKIQDSARARWRKAGIPATEVAEWDAARFRPEEAASWKIAGWSPMVARRAAQAGLGPADLRDYESRGIDVSAAVTWSINQVSVEDALHWSGCGLLPEHALAWIECGFDPVAAAPWVRAGLGPSEAREWRALGMSWGEAALWINESFGPSEAGSWRRHGVDVREAVRLRDLGESPLDEDWYGVPLPHRPLWRAAGVEAYEAYSWSTLEDESLAVAEAIQWASYGFCCDEWGHLHFAPYRAAGLDAAEASELRDLLDTIVEVESEPDDWEAAIRAVAGYESAGIPLTRSILARWRGLPAEMVIAAVDRGFTDAQEFEGYVDSDICAEDVRRLSANGAGPDRVKALWAASQLGIADDVASEWIAAGFAVDEIKTWLGTKLNPSVARRWRDDGFVAGEVKRWIAAGVLEPADARIWRESRFKPSEAARWMAAGFKAGDARAWSSADVDPSTAARRQAAGLHPPR